MINANSTTGSLTSSLNISLHNKSFTSRLRFLNNCPSSQCQHILYINLLPEYISSSKPNPNHIPLHHFLFVRLLESKTCWECLHTQNVGPKPSYVRWVSLSQFATIRRHWTTARSISLGVLLLCALYAWLGSKHTATITASATPTRQHWMKPVESCDDDL